MVKEEACGINIGPAQLSGNDPVNATFPLSCDQCSVNGNIKMKIKSTDTEARIKGTLQLGAEIFLKRYCRNLSKK